MVHNNDFWICTSLRSTFRHALTRQHPNQCTIPVIEEVWEKVQEGMPTAVFGGIPLETDFLHNARDETWSLAERTKQQMPIAPNPSVRMAYDGKTNKAPIKKRSTIKNRFTRSRKLMILRQHSYRT